MLRSSLTLGFGHANQDPKLASSPLALHHPAPILELGGGVLLLQVGLLHFETLDFRVQLGDFGFSFLAKLLRLAQHSVLLIGRPLHLLPLLVRKPLVFLADFDTAVLALDTPDMAEFLGAIAAEVVVAHAVVDIDEWHVGTNVALVLAPKTGKRRLGFCQG